MAEKKYRLREVRVHLTKGQSLYSDQPVDTPQSAFEVMRREMALYDREYLCIVNVNAKLKPINFNVVSVGGIDQSAVAIPNVLKSSLLSNAAGFLLLHNHPSGDPTPSSVDIESTKRVIEAGKLMGVQCLDHIIVGAGKGSYFSMREANLADFGKGPVTMTAEEILRVSDNAKAMNGGTKTMAEETKREEISIKFGKGLANPFTSKDGKEFVRIDIPNADPQDKSAWSTFVLPAKMVHENQFGKGLWAKIPADGTTTVTKPVLKGQDEEGKNIWEDVKLEVSNVELKSMVEAYKTKDPQVKDQEKEPKESTREKLDELSKETKEKPKPEKKKSKAKTKGEER